VRGHVRLFASVPFANRDPSEKEEAMSVIVEIRAAEGGEDAKSLVEEQFVIYAKRAFRDGL